MVSVIKSRQAVLMALVYGMAFLSSTVQCRKEKAMFGSVQITWDSMEALDTDQQLNQQQFQGEGGATAEWVHAVNVVPPPSNIRTRYMAKGERQLAKGQEQEQVQEQELAIDGSGNTVVTTKETSQQQKLRKRKREWPELVGTDVAQAKKVLEQETNKGMTIILIAVDEEQQQKAGNLVMSSDFVRNRIRLFYDEKTNTVLRTPVRG